MIRMDRDAGFSLIEALVALVVLAFAGVALLGATESHTQRIAGLESRAIAQWVAENRMAELAVSPQAPRSEISTVGMLGIDWSVRQTIKTTDEPDLLSVELTVSEGDRAAVLSRFSGFVDVGGRE